MNDFLASGGVVFMFVLSFLRDPLNAVVFLFTVVVAVTVHEAAHAWLANRLGDPTARLLGRISLNPAKHLDPIGSLLFILTGFGWGKPVPVELFNLREPMKDNAFIALAGPVSNLLMATIAALVYAVLQDTGNFDFAIYFEIFAYINVMLAVFNLLPIPPLDGSKIYRSILPESLYPMWDFLDGYGIFILLGLFTIGGSFIGSLVRSATNGIMRFLGFDGIF